MENKMGNIQNFFRTRIKRHNSLIKLIEVSPKTDR
jgi:hypothetical protein